MVDAFNPGIGLFVWKPIIVVHTGVATGPIKHESMVRILATLLMRTSEGKIEIYDRNGSGWAKRGCGMPELQGHHYQGCYSGRVLERLL